MDESLFPNITYLLIEACNKINILFSHSSLSSLEHLEKLEVLCCENIEEIISQEEIKTNAYKIILPILQYLFLQRLPTLKAFCLASYNLYYGKWKLEIVLTWKCFHGDFLIHLSLSMPP